MHKFLLRITLSICVIISSIIISADSGGPTSDATGGPYDSNADGCTNSGCHTTYGLNSGTGSITLSGPSEYYPGESYTITVTVEQSNPTPAKYGFQTIALRNSNNAVAGSYSVGSGLQVKTISSRQYVEHNNTTNTSGVWSFTWNAPSYASTVKFWAAGLAANGNNQNTLDYVYTNTLIIEPIQPITISRDSTATSCYSSCDGAASVTVTGGGQSPYTYLWSSNETTASIANKCAGTYTVTVTDNANHQEEFELEILEPAQILANFEILPSSCAFGSGQISTAPTGGHGGYTYLWNDSANTTDSVIYDAGIGSFTVTITDSTGCYAVRTGVVYESNSGLEAQVNAMSENCQKSDGVASVQMTQGNAPYSYLWQGGTTNDTLQGISAGTYSVRVTDNIGCTETFTVEVEASDVEINEDSSLIFNNSCYGGDIGSIKVSIESGVAPYTFQWLQDSSNTSDSAVKLVAGVYQVLVTDNPGCMDTATFEILQPDSVYAIIELDSANEGFYDGHIKITMHGGTPPFTFSLPEGWIEENGEIDSVYGGSYFAYALDSMNCFYPFEIEVPVRLGINPLKRNNLTLYPIPSRDGIFYIQGLDHAPVNVTITDTKGVTLRDQLVNDSRIDLCDFMNGIYYIQLSSDQIQSAHKVIVLKP